MTHNPETSNQDSASRERIQVVRGAYEHAWAVYNDDIATQRSYQQTVQRLMTIQALLFASMSFALGHTEWAWKSGGAHPWILCGLAILGGLFLVFAFCFGIRAGILRKWSAVSVKQLEQRLRDGTIGAVSLEDLYKGLSTNITTALNENQVITEGRGPLSSRLNWCTTIGFALVVCFVTYSMLGKQISTATGATKMSDQPSQDQQPAQTPPSETPPEPATEPPPSVVEPSNQVERAGDSSPEFMTKTQEKG